ncbi:type I-C CRISPR-associated protein Cas8c/Csd1 [uncultured Agathobaculum sp.]|uniref:type I-C CRISPR-associated protein Cas8c/Csd1 n=1 Tax=uncultured Agathobaculum sp. TaxID=2048140 RepID=UPI00296FE320
MILQALTQYYDALNARGEIDAPGWGKPKISYALCLRENGELMQVIPLLREVEAGKKKVLRPREDIRLPAAVKRSSGIASNFLWDNSTYLLGVDNKDKDKEDKKNKPERSLQCFKAAAALHHELLDGVDSPFARAVLAFFDTWNPAEAEQHPALANEYDKIIAAANLVFYANGQYPADDPALCAAWQAHYDSDSDAPKQQCLVTGQLDEIAAVHPSIKGVRDAQSSGAALVSFNAPAFCSYGHEQNYNAPIGKHAAFAYTAALNHLLADQNHKQYIGDTTVIYWADTAEPQYPDVFSMLWGNEVEGWTENDLAAALKFLAHGDPCKELKLDPNRNFYILGLAPNAARLSVRFFLRNTFGTLMKNVNAHYERLEIDRPSFAPTGYLPLWQLLAETVNQSARDKKPSPVMAGATARAIWNGELYPAALLNGIMLRIRADSEVNWRRAAILKAYLMQNYNNHPVLQEVAYMHLNEDCTYQPYVLGQLFYVLEEIQLASVDYKINRSIKDSYFRAAGSTPKTAFTKIIPLSEYHMKKLLRDKHNYAVKLQNEKEHLLSLMTETLPSRYTPEETICFYLGYYHRKVKEDK